MAVPTIIRAPWTLLGGTRATRGVRETAATDELRVFSSLACVDYADAFLVEPGLAPDQTPEEWARAFFEDGPILIRSMLPRGWASLGLRLGPSQSDRLVFGWPVRRATRDLLLLGADSSQGMPAELLFKRHHDALLFATFVQHDNPLVRARWAAVAPRHRQIVRYMLGHAAARGGHGEHEGGKPNVGEGRRRSPTVQGRRGA